MSGASIETLVDRTRYRNRKGRRAWKRLGKIRLDTLFRAGVRIDMVDK